MAIDKTVTKDDIKALRDEAASAGDAEQVILCDAALAGDSGARLECEETILTARYEDDGEDD